MTATRCDDHTETVLTDDMLARFDERAPVVRPREPLLPRGLRGAARLAATSTSRCPTEFGGARARPRRRAASSSAGSRTSRRRPRSPSTCTSTGPASPPTCTAPGDTSCDWILREAADGEVFAAGHGEAGNDIPLLLSSSKAERVDGGWEITGHKIFGSLSPVWTYLGLHAMDTSDPTHPQDRPRVPAPRRPRATASRRRGTRSACAATESHDTILDHAFVPDEHVGARVPGRVRRRRTVPGSASSPGRLLGFAAVYVGHRPARVRR